MKSFKLSPGWLTGILIAVFFVIAFFFRVFFPYDHVFTGDWIKFTSVDAYYQMRLVDNLVHNFPTLFSFDPYFIYPGGTEVISIHFFNWLLALIIWLFSFGSPSQHTIDVIGVYYPVILSSLTVIPVFFIGKVLYNRWTGIMAAALIAVLPGEFLGRTFLGFTDTPAAETLLTAVIMAFLLLAVRSAQEKHLEFTHILKGDRSAITKPLVYSLLCGIFIGLYSITWQGSLLFVFIITLYLVIQFIIDHFREKSAEYLGIIGFVIFLVALVIYLPYSLATLFSAAMVFAVVIPVVLGVLHYFMGRKGVKPAYYPLALVGIAVIGMAIFYAASPELLKMMLAKFSIFAPGGATAATTVEMQPFLSPGGSFTTAVGWGNFTTSFFFGPWWLIPGFGFAMFCGLIYRVNTHDKNARPLLVSLGLSVIVMIIAAIAGWGNLTQSSSFNFSWLISSFSYVLLFSLLYRINTHGISGKFFFILLGLFVLTMIMVPFIKYQAGVLPLPGLAFIAFVWLIWDFIKKRNDDKTLMLFIVWTLVILVATLVQRRFAYYFVVNVALLTAFAAWQTIWYSGLKSIAGKSEAALETDVPKLAQGKHRPGPAAKKPFTIYHLTAILAVIIVILLAYLPNFIKSKEVASQALYAPTDAWHETLSWMKVNTPDPFPEADYYYKQYQPVPAGTSYVYPDTAYGVTAWWDYGYWITRIAQRLPNANPGQSAVPIKNVGQFFLSQDEASAGEAMLKLDSRYIVIDYLTTTQKLWAVITYSDREQTEFYDVYHFPQGKTLVPVQVYRPEYYRSICVRLFNFDGRAVTDVKPVVFTYEEKKSKEGKTYKHITDVKEMESYQEALDYVQDQTSGKRSIVGLDPFLSCVPLEALEKYELIYSSTKTLPHQELGGVSEVKVFEYLGKR